MRGATDGQICRRAVSGFTEIQARSPGTIKIRKLVPAAHKTVAAPV